jgi:Flp pilus assembly protein TadG
MNHTAENKEKGVAALELALILPILCVMAFGIIDFGRLIQARLVVANVSREGGSLASREIMVGNTLLDALQASTSPLNLRAADGRIYVTRIKAGASLNSRPVIESQVNSGRLSISSGIRSSLSNFGLSPELYDHLIFKGNPQNTSDISDLTVVEVFYKYRPITPLPNFIQNILLTDGGGIIIGSKSVF